VIDLSKLAVVYLIVALIVTCYTVTLAQVSGQSLQIISRVNDTLGGNVKPSDFSMIVGNLNTTNSTEKKITQTLNFINGSDSPQEFNMLPGSFFIKDNQLLSKPITKGYNFSFSGDCKPVKVSDGTVIALGKIVANDKSICKIDRILKR